MKNNLVELKLFLIFISMLTLTACQNLSPDKTATTKQNWQQHKQQIQEIEKWQIGGKIGMTYPYQGKSRSSSARIEWQQLQRRFNVDLYGPMGIGHFNIKGGRGLTILTNHQGKKYRASSPENLFYRATGMSLPITQLTYWIKGLPSPETDFEEKLNEQNLLAELKQSNWTIQYLEYQDTLYTNDNIGNSTGASKNTNVVMPRKIKLSDGNMKITLIIKSWAY